MCCKFNLFPNNKLFTLPNQSLQTISNLMKINCRKFDKCVDNTVGKGEMLVTSNFSFSHNVIYLKTDNTNLLILSLLSAKFIVLIASRFKFCLVKLDKSCNLSHIKFRGLQVLTIYLGKFHFFFVV